MECNDKIGYHTHKKLTAIREIDWLNDRIEWLKHGENHCLQLEEVAVLVKLHRATLEIADQRREEATKWLNNAAKDIDPEWLRNKTERLADILLGERIPLDFVEAGEVLIRAGQKISKTMLHATAIAYAKELLWIDPSPIRNRVFEILAR